MLHALVDFPGMPIVELTAVKRYGGLIAKAAQHVRAGRWPELSADLNESIAFVPCKLDEITELVVRLYDAAPTDTPAYPRRSSRATGS
jgi:exodeoxyribonuclease V alpha subunit